MRFVLIIALILSSCLNEISKQELFYSNSYTFRLECKASAAKLFVPNTLMLTETKYHLTFTRYRYENEKVILKIIFDSNPSKQKLTDIYINSPKKTNSLNDLYNKKDDTIIGMISPNNYVHIFSIASGYCAMIYNFNDSVSANESKKLFHEYINSIDVVSLDNKPYIIESPHENDPIIPIEKDINIGRGDILSISGDLILYNELNSVIFKHNEDETFNNCSELALYYTDIIFPYYDQLNNNTLFTILDKDASNSNILNEHILLQFLIRKSTSHPMKYPDEILGPVYINDNLKIKNKSLLTPPQ